MFHEGCFYNFDFILTILTVATLAICEIKEEFSDVRPPLISYGAIEPQARVTNIGASLVEVNHDLIVLF